MNATPSRKNQVYIGRPIPRVEDFRLLTGTARFVDDLHFENELYAVILRSPVSHGRIRSIDASGALLAPGVHCVITGKEIGEAVPRIPFRIARFEEASGFRQPVIATDRVRYVGEPIAVILADSIARGEDALELIELDIEEIDPVPTAEIGLEDATLLHPDAKTNKAYQYTATRGDIDDAFAQASCFRKETFQIQRHTAIPMETRGLVAEYDEAEGHLTVWGAAKVPFFNRTVLAGMLAMSEEDIDLVEVDVGGGFGVRGEFYPEDFLIPFAARHVARPVRWVEDRREHLAATNHSREMTIEAELACGSDGRILGLRGRVVADLGAYVGTTGGILASRAAQFLSGPYLIPAAEIVAVSVVTNKTPSGSYRGPGRFESCFARERLLDMAAADLGLDPLEIRRRNLLKSDQLPFQTGRMVPYEAGASYDHGDHLATLERCIQEIGWDDKAAVRGTLVDGRYHGSGLASFIDSSGAGPGEYCRLSVDADGMVSVFIGSTSVGQGIETAFTQICADLLELPMERIRIFHGSTNLMSEGHGSFHSRSIIMGGNALAGAAENLKSALTAEAARIFGCDTSDVQYKSDTFTNGLRNVLTIKDVVGSFGKDLEVEYRFPGAKKPYGYGTHAAHVAVDAKTGHVELIDYVAVEDVGKMINPLLVHGQKIGAIVQGLGGTFLEQLTYDDMAQLLTGSLVDYLLPTATDFPNVRAVCLELVHTTRNPLGVKGVGEDAIAPVAAAVANAVADALISFDVQPRALPLTPLAVWGLIQESVRDSNGKQPASGRGEGG